MRTGFDVLQEPPSMDVDFMRMIVSMMSVLNEEAMLSGAKFAKCCGRRTVTPQDIILALKYESHVFWEKDIDERFVERLKIERTHNYDTEEETDDEGEEQEEEEEEEEFSGEFVTGDKAFYDRVMTIRNEWDSWNPDDEAKKMLKRAIQSTESKFFG